MSKALYRIGQTVPSSNTTIETEIPAMLLARQAIRPERFSFHSSRMRMKHVVKEELEAMKRDSDRCALELSDAQVDVLGYACLVAIMSMGHGYHCVSERRLHQRTVDNGAPAPVVARVEAETGIPVGSAAVYTTHAMLKRLGLKTVVPGAGSLLSGRY